MQPSAQVAILHPHFTMSEQAQPLVIWQPHFETASNALGLVPPKCDYVIELPY